jgi:hypothetical protein
MAKRIFRKKSYYRNNLSFLLMTKYEIEYQQIYRKLRYLSKNNR